MGQGKASHSLLLLRRGTHQGGLWKRGLPVSLDIPNDATPEELEELKAFDAWTRDGQPVED